MANTHLTRNEAIGLAALVIAIVAAFIAINLWTLTSIWDVKEDVLTNQGAIKNIEQQLTNFGELVDRLEQSVGTLEQGVTDLQTNAQPLTDAATLLDEIRKQQDAILEAIADQSALMKDYLGAVSPEEQ